MLTFTHPRWRQPLAAFRTYAQSLGKVSHRRVTEEFVRPRDRAFFSCSFQMIIPRITLVIRNRPYSVSIGPYNRPSPEGDRRIPPRKKWATESVAHRPKSNFLRILRSPALLAPEAHPMSNYSRRSSSGAIKNRKHSLR